MSKRKPVLKSKHSRGPKMAAKAQRVAQSVVRSPKANRPRSIEAASTESLPERHNEQESSAGDATAAFQQDARLEPATALQDERSVTMKGFDFSPVTANVRAFQAKLLEVAQNNVQFAFEFAERLAAIRSPVEFLSVTAEFTSRRRAMFLKHSKELAVLSAVVRTRNEK
jgi:hypothetical protein